MSGRSGGVLWWVSETDGRATSIQVRAEGIPPVLLRRDPDGDWRDEAHNIAPGTDYPDIGVTAYTNSLPIRTLGLAVGESAAITALWLPPSDFAPRKARQRYSRIAHSEWRYENLDSGFSAVLAVDMDGLVLDYPGICQRVA